jgi:SAM-dependent methyltransferase
MSGPHPIFDRDLAVRRLLRAVRAGPAEFLVERAADDLADRLDTVLRDFPVALDLSTPTPHAARVLEAQRRVGQVVTAVSNAALAAGRPGLALVADPERLPLAPASIDLAVSLLALHTANDLPGVLVQIRRALRPDGLLLACLPGGSTLTELRQALAIAESEVEGGVSPRVFPFADVRDMGALLQRAGFALPVTDVDSVVVRYADPLRLMRDLRAMGATNVLIDRRRTPLRRDTLLRSFEVYAERFSDQDGRIRATFELVWVSGWAPHESQQKPLRPGSAKARLADALGVPERPAGDTPEGRD